MCSHSLVCQRKSVKVTVTDNGSNFVKAFAEFGVKLEDPDTDENQTDENESADFADVDFILETPQMNNETANIQDDNFALHTPLPQHHHCNSHTLSLINASDINKLVSGNPTFGRVHHASMAKCTAISNKCAHSHNRVRNILPF